MAQPHDLFGFARAALCNGQCAGEPRERQQGAGGAHYRVCEVYREDLLAVGGEGDWVEALLCTAPIGQRSG